MYTEVGHRERVRSRFLQEGLDHFDEVHVLELMLFYAIPRKDTKPLARALLQRFGGFRQVLEATAEELKTVEGVGDQVAAYLTMFSSVARYYYVHAQSGRIILDTVEKCGKFLVDHFIGRRNETVYLLSLDAKCKLLACSLIAEGDVNSANVPVRKVVETALGTNATTVILCHNHPSGLAIPSVEDRNTTERLARALSAMDICLADHIIVADSEFVSLVQSGLYDPRHF